MSHLNLAFFGLKKYEEKRHEIHNFLEENCLGDKMLIEVGINEAIINAIKHGNQFNKNKKVSISLRVTNANRLIVRVKDEGEGFEWNRWFKNVVGNLEGFIDRSLEKDHGRGLFIIYQVFDYITFNKQGNEILFVKDFSEDQKYKNDIKYREEEQHEEFKLG